jgi:hypothetical protein
VNVTSLTAFIKFRFRVLFFKYLSRYDTVIWLIGSGRSGTTWVSNIINHKKDYRELFEPFHPKTIRYAKGWTTSYQYIRKGETAPGLVKFAEEVFTGKFVHRNIDKGNKTTFYNKLLVKDIHANLFAHFLSGHFPHVKLLMVIRNPFAVALSKYKTKDHGWITEPAEFLRQSQLVKDFLQPYTKLIEEISESNDYIVKQILVWSIINYVPLRQFPPDKLLVVFYEDLISKPNAELARIERYVYPDAPTSAFVVSQQVLNTPSRVTRKGKQNFSLSEWQKDVSPAQVQTGNLILKAFGFENLYNEQLLPNHEVVEALRTAPRQC